MSAKRRYVLKVSDHALARYAERVLGLDRKQIFADLRRMVGPAAEVCPDCRAPFVVGGEEYVAVIKGRRVLTILPRRGIAKAVH